MVTYKEYAPTKPKTRALLLPPFDDKWVRIIADGGVGNMTERWLICDDPSLLCLSNIGCGAMHLQSASLKPCEQAPIFNLRPLHFVATAIAFGLIAAL